MGKGSLISGIILFVITLVFGIVLLSNPFDSGLELWAQTPVWINFVVWVTSIVMIITGAKQIQKSQKIKENEIQELKDKVKKLEEKEKSKNN